MEVQTSRTVQIQDQENVNAVKGKSNIALPVKKQGLAISTRGALGDINTNIQIQRDVTVGKVACATAKFEKNKATLNRGAIKCNNSHVQSKIPIQASSRLPLRHEESTAGLANRPVACTRAALKEKPVETKDSINFYIQRKKTESRKITKLPGMKEQKEYHTLKPILKEPTESLGQLKLAEEKSSDSINFYMQTKKTESRKITKLPGMKEQKEYHTLKPILKEPTESLGKLKLAEEKSSDSINFYMQTKKTESRKITKLPGMKEQKEYHTLKPILKEPTESLGKLKLAEEKSSDSINFYMQTKKTESRKITKLPGMKEQKEYHTLKPILKEPTESLGKLKLAEEKSSDSINFYMQTKKTESRKITNLPGMKEQKEYHTPKPILKEPTESLGKLKLAEEKSSDSINFYMQTKKTESRKITNLPGMKEQKEYHTPKPILKEPTESLGKLKLAEEKSSDSINFYMQTKKTESRKITNLPGMKEQKEYHTPKPILKEPTESLGKLKLAEEKSSLIDHVKLQKHAACLHEILDTTPELPDDIEDIDAGDHIYDIINYIMIWSITLYHLIIAYVNF